MARLNVFGRVINPDPGVVDAKFSTKDPVATKDIEFGSDVSDFTLSQVASYAAAQAAGLGDLGLSSRLPISPFGDQVFTSEPQVDFEKHSILTTDGKIPEQPQTDIGYFKSIDDRFRLQNYPVERKDVISLERQAERSEAPSANRLFETDGLKHLDEKLVSPLLARSRFAAAKQYQGEVFLPLRQLQGGELQRGLKTQGYDPTQALDVTKLLPYFGRAFTKDAGTSLFNPTVELSKVFRDIEDVIGSANALHSNSNEKPEVLKLDSSYGSSYAPGQTLTDQITGGPKVAATQAGLLVISGALITVAKLLSFGKSDAIDSETGRPFPGKYARNDDVTEIFNTIGIPEQGANFFKDVILGTASLFPTVTTPAQTVDSFISAGISSPFYDSLIRTIFRDIQAFSSDLVSAGGVVGIVQSLLSGLVPTNIISGPIQALQKLKNLKILKLALLVGELGRIKRQKQASLEIEQIDLGAFSVRQSNGMLGMASNQLPGAYLIPQSLLVHSQGKDNNLSKLGKLAVSGSIDSRDTRVFVPTDGTNKITAEQVADIESMLESEYMPFYIQDLRTNEIISFHAFIEDLAEDYSVTTNAEKAVGRMDPVLVYESTTRTVNVSFFVVATDPDDFDMMWYKINKLTTLIYPQWTEGERYIADDGTSFVRPFSQIPGASPLIRMRVGDMISSNFSKFNLRRIFGIPDAAKYKATLSEKETRTELLPGEYTIVASVGTKYSSPTIKIFDPVEIQNSFGAESLPLPAIQPPDNVEIASLNMVDLGIAGFSSGYVTVKASADRVVRRKSYIAENAVLTERETFKQAIVSFEKDNIVLNAFQQNSPGKGLAGMINKFGISSNPKDFPWETQKFGGRAPMVVKVDLGMGVIHDIAPGLAADGSNRAPIYPVGDIINSLYQTNRDVKTSSGALDELLPGGAQVGTTTNENFRSAQQTVNNRGRK